VRVSHGDEQRTVRQGKAEHPAPEHPLKKHYDATDTDTLIEGRG
jgi:hypothetical protein